VLGRRGVQVLTATGLAPYVEGQTVPFTQPRPVVGGVMRWVDTHQLRARVLG